MSSRLDTEIRRAMSELANAAPLPRPVPANELVRVATRPIGPRRRRLAAAIVGIGAVAAAAGTAFLVRGDGDVRPGVSPSDVSQAVPQASSTLLPTTAPTVVVPTTGPTAAPTVVVPTTLPDGWKIWTFSRASVASPPLTQQLFGAYDGSVVATGVLIAISKPDQFVGVQGGEKTVLRGHDAWWFAGSEPDRITWAEGGVVADVQSRGLDRMALVHLLEGLTFRNDPMEGFEPASSSAEVPLRSEWVFDPLAVQVMTTFRLSPIDGPVFTPGHPPYVGHQVDIRVSDQSGLFGSVPDLMYRGTRDSNGIVTTEGPTGPQSIDALLADGTIVNVVVLQGEDPPKFARQLLGDLRRVGIEELDRLQDSTSTWFAHLPAVASADVGDATITLRGGAIDDPTSLCLTLDTVERCRWSIPASPARLPSSLGTLDIDGHLFAYGVEPADEPDLQLFAWQPDMSATIDRTQLIPQTEITVGQHRWWVARIPDDVVSFTTATADAITFDHTELQSATRRRDR